MTIHQTIIKKYYYTKKIYLSLNILFNSTNADFILYYKIIMLYLPNKTKKRFFKIIAKLFSNIYLT